MQYYKCVRLTVAKDGKYDEYHVVGDISSIKRVETALLGTCVRYKPENYRVYIY